MSSFDTHKVHHLFLLLGENPLPNYVAAKLLLNQEGIIYLTYTKGTEAQHKQLKKILCNESQRVEDISLGTYESDAFRIRDAVKPFFKHAVGSIGLNYTGGTKAMAVHAYRVLKEIKPDAKFSYLDSRRLEMCIDREEGDRIRLKVQPSILQVDLAKIFQLHGWELQSPPISKPELSDAAQAFAKFHQDEASVACWRNWCDGKLREAAKNPKKPSEWVKEKVLKDLPPLSLETLKSNPRIIEALSYFNIDGNNISLELNAVKGKDLKDLETACQWLDGEWLEHYVLHQVQKISEQYSIHESATSFWIKDPIEPRKTKFQFDVAFMRGYQLFAISCTTIANRGDCKQKLFEAYIRAQQLGGSEARVALVCCASQKDINALRTQIKNVLKPDSDTEPKDSKIAVFGRDSLSNLSDEIGEWIKQNDRETNS